MSIRFGPAGLGGVEGAVDTLKEIHKMGLRACEIAFTYSIYIKNKEDALRIGKVAKELDIALSIHAPYFLNLNSGEREKTEASKKRILDCCEIGELLGARVVVFHPGYYLKDRIESYNVIKAGILEIKDKIKEKGWKVNIAPETMGKINVFGSIEEIGRLKRERIINILLTICIKIFRGRGRLMMMERTGWNGGKEGMKEMYQNLT